MNAQCEDIIYFFEVRWLSCGKITKGFFELIDKTDGFFTEKESIMPEFSNFKWIMVSFSRGHYNLPQ